METFSSLVKLLARRAKSQPDQRAYVFLSDRGEEEAAITFRELYDAALATASRLAKIARPGDRAILVFPPGLEFIIAFFVAGPNNTLPMYVFASIRRGITPEINAIGTVVLTVSLTLLLIAQLILRRSSPARRAAN